MAEFQEKIKASNPTGLPGLMSPRYPDDKFHKRVVFPTDKTTRRDIQTEIDATRDDVYAQILAKREERKQEQEEKVRDEMDYISQIKESLQQANKKKRSLIY